MYRKLWSSSYRVCQASSYAPANMHLSESGGALAPCFWCLWSAQFPLWFPSCFLTINCSDQSLHSVKDKKLVGLKFDRYGEFCYFIKVYRLIAKISLITSMHTCNSEWICQTFFHQNVLLADLPNFIPVNFCCLQYTPFLNFIILGNSG